MADTSTAPNPNQQQANANPRHISGVFAGELDQKLIERDIMGGLPNQLPRMRDAYECLRYSQARFEEYPTRHKDMRYRSPSVRRTSRIFGRIMEILTMHLYKNSPNRKLPDPEASTWLEAVYKRNGMSAKWKRADQLSLVTGFAAFQFAGGTDPKRPLRINLWGGDQVAFWVDPEDPTKPGAVACVDYFDSQRRLRLWTQDQIVTYATEKGNVHPAFGGTSFKFLRRRDNPYRTREGRGIVPFSFCHWEFPTQEFTTNSPGLNLKELNHGVNERIDNLGDSIYFNGKPIGLARNVDASWTPPAELRPGDFITLPADNVDAGGNGPEPTLSYLLPDLNYVTKDWEDLNNNLDHQLEMWGVPPSMIRMAQTGTQSGRALVAEQLPILGWVEGRRGDWAHYEEEAALAAYEVAEAHLRNVGLQAEADQLQRLIDEWSFMLRWPTLYIQLPGPERDAADDWRLGKKIVSIVGIVQERQDVTEDEAFGILQKVKEQNDRLISLGIQNEPVNPLMIGAGPEGDPYSTPADGAEGAAEDQLQGTDEGGGALQADLEEAG